jgi:hypothetical protein
MDSEKKRSLENYVPETSGKDIDPQKDQLHQELERVSSLIKTKGAPDDITAIFEWEKGTGVLQWGDQKEEFDPRILFHNLPLDSQIILEKNKEDNVQKRINYSLLVERDDIGDGVLVEVEGFYLNKEHLDLSRVRDGFFKFNPAQFSKSAGEFTPSEIKQVLAEKITRTSVPEINEQRRRLILEWDGSMEKTTNNSRAAQLAYLVNGIRALKNTSPQLSQKHISYTGYIPESNDSMRGGYSSTQERVVDVMRWRDYRTLKDYEMVFGLEYTGGPNLRDELFSALKKRSSEELDELIAFSRKKIAPVPDDPRNLSHDYNNVSPEKRDQYEKLKKENDEMERKLVSMVEDEISSYEDLEKNWSKSLQLGRDRFDQMNDLFENVTKAFHDINHPSYEKMKRLKQEFIKAKDNIDIARRSLAEPSSDSEEMAGPFPDKGKFFLNVTEENIKKLIGADQEKWLQMSREYFQKKETDAFNHEKIRGFIETIMPGESQRLRRGKIEDLSLNWDKYGDSDEVDEFGRVIISDIIARKESQPDLLVGRIYYQKSSSGAAGNYNLGNRDRGNIYLLLGDNIKKEGDQAPCWNGQSKIEGELFEEIRSPSR